jgi:hypothetical protein
LKISFCRLALRISFVRSRPPAECPGDRLRTAGKTTEEIVQMWNEDYPEDMITLAAEPPPQPA